MDGQRMRDQFSARRVRPDLEAPGLLRSDIDRTIPAAIEIDLKARAVEHHPVRHIPNDEFSEWVFLAHPSGVIKRHCRSHVVAQSMPVMDRRAHNWRSTALHRPQSGIRDTGILLILG